LHGTLINVMAHSRRRRTGLLFREALPERISPTALQVMGVFSRFGGDQDGIARGKNSSWDSSVGLGIHAGGGEWVNFEDRLENSPSHWRKRFHLTEVSPAKVSSYASLFVLSGSLGQWSGVLQMGS